MLKYILCFPQIKKAYLAFIEQHIANKVLNSDSCLELNGILIGDLYISKLISGLRVKQDEEG